MKSYDLDTTSYGITIKSLDVNKRLTFDGSKVLNPLKFKKETVDDLTVWVTDEITVDHNIRFFENGTELTSRVSISEVRSNPGSYYYDSTGHLLYVQSSESTLMKSDENELIECFHTV